jgi:hypothetical protein
MKTETKQDVRKVDSAKIKDLPPQFDDYLQAMKENITADKMYFLEMKGTGAYQGNKDSFPQGVRQKVIDHQLEPNATIISFHRRNIKKTLEENNSQSKAVQCGLLFRHPEGYEAGKSIGTNMPKDGTVNNLQEITESLKDEPLLLENAGLFLHDTLILQSTPQEIKEYISQIGEQKTIGLWQVATKDSDKMDKNMILAQKRLKQAGHKGNCYLITDHKDDIIRLASKDD